MLVEAAAVAVGIVYLMLDRVPGIVAALLAG